MTFMKYLFKTTRKSEFKICIKMINIKWSTFRNMDIKTLLNKLLLIQKFLIRNAVGKCLKIKDLN
jgi:hypothetical protein